MKAGEFISWANSFARECKLFFLRNEAARINSAADEMLRRGFKEQGEHYKTMALRFELEAQSIEREPLAIGYLDEQDRKTMIVEKKPNE